MPRSLDNLTPQENKILECFHSLMACYQKLDDNGKNRLYKRINDFTVFILEDTKSARRARSSSKNDLVIFPGCGISDQEPININKEE